MGWREVVIESPCKISCQNSYLIVRSSDVRKIHLSEIKYLIISNPAVNITGIALCELSRNKIKVIFCDEKHNPFGELVSLYGSHNTSKKVLIQTMWDSKIKSLINTEILKTKIVNQANLLSKVGYEDRAYMLFQYAEEIELDDTTNREGHSAKVYFNTLFGNEFNRDMQSNANSALNYGYSIILSAINREVVANGCITQLGINHCNEYNEFNLSCDLIEPFRVIVDEFVYHNKDKFFDKEFKHDLINLLNKKVCIDSEMFLANAISYSVRTILVSLNSKDISLMKLYHFI